MVEERAIDEVLFPRQVEVVRLVAAGWSRKEIALRLCIRPNTVRKHLDAIHRRLGVQSNAELLIVVFGSGWVDPAAALAELQPRITQVLAAEQAIRGAE